MALTSHQVSGNLQSRRAELGRSIAWLSEQSGISYKTLRRRLYGDPSAFTLSELSALARTLEVDLEVLFVEAVLSDGDSTVAREQQCACPIKVVTR